MSKSAKGKKARPRKSGLSGRAGVEKPNWAAQVEKAERDTARNTGRILAGETFAAGRRSGPEKSPSSNHDGRYA